VACAVLIQAGSSVVMMMRMARRLRSSPDWLDLDEDWADKAEDG
jgi:hypothetical protein